MRQGKIPLLLQLRAPDVQMPTVCTTLHLQHQGRPSREENNTEVIVIDTMAVSDKVPSVT